MNSTDTCDRVLLDGALIAAVDARISPLSDGFMTGHGLFETIKVSHGRPVFFDQHESRLCRSAAELGLSPNVGLRGRAEEVIAANALTNGVVKIVVFQDERGPSELILARTLVYPETKYAVGFSLKTFPDARNADGLGRLKTLNYLKNSQARRKAREAGFDEALLVDEMQGVLEGAATNIFLVKNGKVSTPLASSGILPGIARAVVLKLFDGKQIEASQVTAAMLEDADEVFVTNALVGVMPVARVDDRVYASASESSVTRKIRAAYRAAELRSIGA